MIDLVMKETFAAAKGQMARTDGPPVFLYGRIRAHGLVGIGAGDAADAVKLRAPNKPWYRSRIPFHIGR